MASPKEGSVAPKERINIRYVPATLGQIAEVELPLRLVVVGDFLGREDASPVEERKTLQIDKNTFADVMEKAGLERQFTVANRLVDEDADMRVDLKFRSLRDFEPDSVVRQVPELQKLLELREALVALKGPVGNMPAFRRRLQQLLDDEASRDRLLAELDALETPASPASAAAPAASGGSPAPEPQDKSPKKKKDD
jgi:type VI secretion system protein ImpB